MFVENLLEIGFLEERNDVHRASHLSQEGSLQLLKWVEETSFHKYVQENVS